MKVISGLILIVLFVFGTSGCTGKGPGSRKSITEADTVAVPDTGYTGIRQYFSKELLVKEVSFMVESYSGR